MQFKKNKKNVVSKKLLAGVEEFVEDGLNTSNIVWSSDAHREAFCDVIEGLLEQLETIGAISQAEVICDFRNNRISQMEKGFFKLLIKFKQQGCYITTELEYEIDVSEDDDIELDFDLMFP